MATLPHSHSRSDLLRFLHEVLGLDENTALEDSCKLEHLIGRLTTERLVRFTRFLVEDPDGIELIQRFNEELPRR